MTVLPGARNVRTRGHQADRPDGAAPRAKETPVATGESRVFRVLRALLGLLMIVAIGGSVAWGARHYVKTSARFAVSEIVTIGGKRRSPDELAATASVGKNQNVFSIDLDRARARLLADPWISEAHVARQLPGTLTIRVTEREAAGVVAMVEGTYLVTREGSIIKRAEPDDPVDLPVVTGVSLQQLVDDREGATRTIRRALDLASDYERSPLAHRSPAQEVHVEGNGDLTLVVGKSTVMIRMGTAPYRRKLEQAARVVAELDRRGAKPDAIMLDDESRPDRVVVRMR
jgi:cell division protein FtsQ